MNQTFLIVIRLFLEMVEEERLVAGWQVPVGSWRLLPIPPQRWETQREPAYPTGMTNRVTSRGPSTAALMGESSVAVRPGPGRSARRSTMRRARGAPRATTGTDGAHETSIPQLTLWRFSNPTEPAHVVMQPAVYVVVQGRKHVTVGDATYVYDPSQYLAVSLELPVVAHIAEASPEAPYLCMTLRRGSRELAALIVETDDRSPATSTTDARSS